MPYNRRYYKRRPKRKFKASALKVAKKALRKVNKIQKQIEYKWYDVQLVDLNTDANGTLWDLNTVPLGDEPSQRIGQKIYCTSINLRMYFEASSVAQGLVRVIILKDFKNTLTLANILANTTDDKWKVLSMYNKDFKADWKVLRDFTFSLVDLTQTMNKTITMKIPLRFETTFEGLTTTIENNALSLAVWSTVPSGAGSKCNTSIQYRLNYSDL